MPRVDRIRVVGTFERHDQASAALKLTGDAALVHRGVPRILLIRCPCDCGDTLVINLDRRAGKAWRMYERGNGISLFPSYWRDTACESHFVLWSDRVLWCDWEGLRRTWIGSDQTEHKVLRALTNQFESYDVIADRVDEIPWDVLRSCWALVEKRKAEMREPPSRGEFRRKE